MTKNHFGDDKKGPYYDDKRCPCDDDKSEGDKKVS